MTKLGFVDIETTSLARPFSPTPGEVWEVGLIVSGENDLGRYEIERTWLLPVTLEHADPVSLDIGRFHERHPQGDRYRGPDGLVTPLPLFVGELVGLLDGCHLVGNVVSFDEERLAALLLARGIDRMPWHYHLVDVEALAAGYLAGMGTVVDEHGIPSHAEDSYGHDVHEAAKLAPPPWKSDALCAALGVDMPNDEDRHTALGDARWARATYDAVMGNDR